MTRIAFTADLHVDAYGSKVDPDTGLNARLVDYLETLRWVANRAREEGCEVLVVAGDFTERRHPAPWLVSRIRDALSGGPPMQVYLRGNHDGEIGGGSIVTVLSDGDAHIGVSRPAIVAPNADAVLALIPYLDRHWLRAQPGYTDVSDAQLYAALAEQFLVVARGLYAEARKLHQHAGVVLVCHQTLAGAHMSETQQAFLGDQQVVVSAADLASIGFEAVVAGHLHRHQVLSADPVLYPGSIERVDFGEEHEAKGFVVADVARGRFDWDFVETPARRFVTLTQEGVYDVAGAIVRGVDLDPQTDLAELRTKLEARGAFDIVSLAHRPVDAPAIAGGLSESLSAEQALSAYFADDPDREALVARGREVLEAVRS